VDRRNRVGTDGRTDGCKGAAISRKAQAIRLAADLSSGPPESQSPFRSAPAPSGPVGWTFCGRHSNSVRSFIFAVCFQVLSRSARRGGHYPGVPTENWRRLPDSHGGLTWPQTRKTAVSLENIGVARIRQRQFAPSSVTTRFDSFLHFLPLGSGVVPVAHRDARSVTLRVRLFVPVARFMTFYIQLSKTTGRQTPTRQGGWTCRLP
jgi:hypothetical protein